MLNNCTIPSHKLIMAILHYLFNHFSCRSTGPPFWFGLILPFLLIYIFNWIVFIIIMTSIYKKSKKQEKKVARTKKLTMIAIGLSLLFGLGWAFGLSATSSNVEEVTFAFQLIFSIFVGSQGLLIFIFHGIRSKNVSKQWKSWLEKYLHIKKKAKRQTYVTHSQNTFPSSSRSGHAYGGTLITGSTSTFSRDTLLSSPPSSYSTLSSPTEDAITTSTLTWQESNKPANTNYEMTNKEHNDSTNDTTQKSDLGNTADSAAVHSVVIENENAYEKDADELGTQL